MIRKILLSLIFILGIYSVYAEKWTTIKEYKAEWQYINISESDTKLCTLAASTTFSDGVVIFYIHAGVRDKQILLNIYDACSKNLSTYPSSSIVEFASSYVNNLRNKGTLSVVNFETDPIEYTSFGIPCVKTHLYCSSWLEGVLRK